MRKWKLFFIVLAKKWRQEKTLQKYCHFFICSSCVFTTAARRVNNKFIQYKEYNNKLVQSGSEPPSVSLHYYSESVHTQALTA